MINLTSVIKETDRSILILSAGMPRSGSTWLYNAARLLLLDSDRTRNITGYGWIQDLPTIPRQRILLIKIHDFSDDIVRLELPKIILYSYRDIRDALASAKRKWGREPSRDMADSYIQNDFQWRKCADFIMRYESMIKNPYAMLSELSGILTIKDVAIDKILSQIDTLSYESPGKKNEVYNMENLLHKGHITNGRYGSWREILDKTFVEQLEIKYRNWFAENNY